MVIVPSHLRGAAPALPRRTLPPAYELGWGIEPRCLQVVLSLYQQTDLCGQFHASKMRRPFSATFVLKACFL